MKKGGILIISKDDANIYNKVQIALTEGKPILWYEDATTCYYIDTISKSGDDIVLTKGGKTITITDANVVTESGDIQTHLYKVSISLEYSGDEIDAEMLVYFNGELTKEIIEENPSILNIYNYLPIYDNNNKVVPLYFEQLYIDEGVLECNLFNTSGEISADTGTTQISDVTKLF